MSSYVIKYEFVGQDSTGLRGWSGPVSGQQVLRAFGWFSTDASMGAPGTGTVWVTVWVLVWVESYMDSY